MLTALKRFYASFPTTKIALLPLLIADISISTISATMVLMLLHFIASILSKNTVILSGRSAAKQVEGPALCSSHAVSQIFGRSNRSDARIRQALKLPAAEDREVIVLPKHIDIAKARRGQPSQLVRQPGWMIFSLVVANPFALDLFPRDAAAHECTPLLHV
jgi:hypothetical protein